MEDVIINDSTISLNLICNTATVSVGSSNSTNILLKKTNKRRKGRRNTKNGTTKNNNTSSTTELKLPNKHSSNNTSTTQPHAQHQLVQLNKEHTTETSSTKHSFSLLNQNGITEAIPTSTNTKGKDSSTKTTKPNISRIEVEHTDIIISSKSNLNNNESKDYYSTDETKQDEVEQHHANYMAQYHARPLEMDRRANAVPYIRPSHSSQHIFGATTTTTAEEQAQSSFEGMGIHPRLITALQQLSFKQPTSIQSNTIPKLLQLHRTSKTTSNGVCIQCETGSGKTIAYLLPIVQSILQSLLIQQPSTDTTTTTTTTGNNFNSTSETATTTNITASSHQQQLLPLTKSRVDIGTRAVIICPTRELATQTFYMASQLLQQSFPQLVCGCLSGGEKRKSEKAKIRKGISILIATPGRLLDHLNKTECLTSSLKVGGRQKWLVLDEVDRLLDMGLKGQLQEIVDRLRFMDKPRMPSRSTTTTTTTTTTATHTNHWKSVLVSATVTPAVLTMAKSILGEEESSFIWSSSQTKRQPQSIPTTTTTTQEDTTNKVCNTTTTTTTTDTSLEDFSRSAPHQLSQLYMVVTSKLRLAALISFLVARVRKGQSVVVFMSTCDSVDFHHALFTKMKSITVSSTSSNGNIIPASGIFGTSCALIKLHGNISHGERQQALKKLSLFPTNPTSTATEAAFTATSARSYVLFATDVAARGLNLPHLDWIVQYDAPCEVTDYVHRVGRSARAGNAGHAIIFLLPSEQGYIDVLKSHGLGNITALSLSSTLQTAAKLCPTVATSASSKDGTVSKDTTEKQSHKSRSGEVFAADILRQCEECVIQDDAINKRANQSVPKKGNQRKEKDNKDDLLSLARQAFNAFIRAYPTKEKSVRHLFATRALHLGHVARSFALKESPITVSKTSKNNYLQKISNKRDNTALAFDGVVTKKRKGFHLSNGTIKDVNKEAAVNAAKNKRQNQMAMMVSARRTEREISEFE